VIHAIYVTFFRLLRYGAMIWILEPWNSLC